MVQAERLDDRDLPCDPRAQDWTPALGPEGRVWVWFELDTDRWIVWDPEVGYRQVGNREFDRAYELDVLDSDSDLPGQEPG